MIFTKKHGLSGTQAAIRFCVLFSLAGLLSTPHSCAAPVLVCPRCGYEYAAADTSCGHCGHTFQSSSASKDEEEAPRVEDADVVKHRVLTKALRQEYQVALEAFEKEDYALAVEFARNARALRAMLGAKVRPPSRDIDALIKRAINGLSSTTRTCFTCKGSRMKVQPILNFKREQVIQNLPGQPCPVCRGKGVLKAGRTSDEIERLRAHAVGRSKKIHQERDFVVDTEGWLPGAVKELLSVQDLAAFRSHLADRCVACLGRSMNACPPCKGIGYTRCTSQSCVMGKEICPTCKGSLRSAENGERQAYRPCPGCKRKGITRCESCRGQARVACTACGGKASDLCQDCKGSGERANCRSCGGEGLLLCPMCDGSAIHKEAECPQCAGEKKSLCTRCDGSGHSGK